MNNRYMIRYEKLMKWADERPLFDGEKIERHHIIPVCFGGGDEEDNLIKLTYAEHVLAHRLLALSYPDCADLWFAYGLISKEKISKLEKNILNRHKKKVLYVLWEKPYNNFQRKNEYEC